VPSDCHTDSDRPLSALLSQVLVAFTIELDNEFERRIVEAGYPGARLSLVLWLNVIRFLAGGGLPVRALAAQALVSQDRIACVLGCLERWGFIVLRPDPADSRPIPFRPHRQVGRGIRAEWIVRLATRGQKAAEIWPPLSNEIEQRWRRRFGDEHVNRLCKSLQAVVGKLEIELPDGFPGSWEVSEAPEFPPRITRGAVDLPLPTLLSRALLAFELEFDCKAPACLALSANTLRVLGEKPVRVGDLARLTGCSPETSGPGWQMKRYIIVEPDPAAKRGKVIRLTPLGRKAHDAYLRLARDIEQHWKRKFGDDNICVLRESLLALFDKRAGGRSLLAEGLGPPPGVVRAGGQMPALGRRDVGAAARQRARDLVAQTELFEGDPANTLPHYPLWDINRGFGP